MYWNTDGVRASFTGVEEFISCVCVTPNFGEATYVARRSQWPRGLGRRSTVARLLILCVRISPGTFMSACCECCVLSGRGLCDEMITCPEESYRVRCVWVWSWSLGNEEALVHWRAAAPQEKKFIAQYYVLVFPGTFIPVFYPIFYILSFWRIVI